MRVVLFVNLILALVIAYFIWLKPIDEVPSVLKPIDEVPSVVSAPSIHRKPYDPFILRSQTGEDVRIVAIYCLSPDGIQYSPEPNAPLIGSNRLKVFKSNWSNIDISSLTQYHELNRPYREVLKRKNISLDIGNHFTTLFIAQQKILEIRPSVKLYFVDGSQRYFDFTSPLYQNEKSYKISRWSMQPTHKSEVLKRWRNIEKLLQPVIYRKDTILFMNRLERAIRGIKNIPDYSKTFNVTAARAIHELINYTYTDTSNIAQ